MAGVNISYKGASIATMDASGSKTLLTQGKYCEDNFSIQYDGVNFAETTYTMPSNVVNTSFTVPCECNFTPKVIICLTEGTMSTSQNVMGMVKSDYVQFAVRGTTTNKYVGGTEYGGISYSNGVITVTSSNSNMVFRSGYKFHFYLIG